MIRQLPRRIEGGTRAPQDRRQHPMRLVTQDVARDDDAWPSERATEVRHYFDGLAGEWQARFVDHPLRLAPLTDALDRGAISRFGRCLDLGSGTGMGAEVLASRFEAVVGVDLSLAMLAEAPSTT